MIFRMLFGIFFPSWKFFDEVSEFPKLYIRTGHCSAELGDWHLSQPRPARRFWLNGPDNLAHAEDTLIQRLLLEASLDQSTDVSTEVSYQLVLLLVRNRLRSAAAPENYWFQFKISMWSEKNGQMTDALLSSVHEVQK